MVLLVDIGNTHTHAAAADAERVVADVTFPSEAIALGQADGAEANRNVKLRGVLQNARIQFEQKKTGRVAFIGGSITQMKGYRPMVSDWLQARFPETKFEFINAGIASTDSQTGAFRLGDHVLAKGRIDMLFVEFAVNDDQDARHSRRGCILGMEGIVRQMRQRQPLSAFAAARTPKNWGGGHRRSRSAPGSPRAPRPATGPAAPPWTRRT